MVQSNFRLDLPGPEGSNPLGYLTALGVLRTLTLMHPDVDVRLGWQIQDGAWRPFIESSNVELEAQSICDSMTDWLNAPPHMKLLETEELGDNLTIAPETFGFLANQFLQRAHDEHLDGQVALDFLAAFGTDAAFQPHSKDRKLMQDTALRTMSGAGWQHFIKFMRDIISNTDSAHLYRTMFCQWKYEDEGRGLNLRYDPIDDRRYALRWKNPSADPARSMRGANRLAIEALPFFATAPMGTNLETTGFRHRRGTFWSWPIWETPIGMQVVQSVLQLAALSNLSDNPTEAHLKEMGVAAIYRSQRITVGKFRNFTPAIMV